MREERTKGEGREIRRHEESDKRKGQYNARK